MKTFLYRFVLMAAFVVAAVGCKITSVDYFVPEVALTEASGSAEFGPQGGNGSLTIQANCDWTISCPADWVELPVSGGDQNTTVTYTVKTTKLPRTTTITLNSNEVESRISELVITQTGVTEISSVDAVTASNLITADGTTATLRSAYAALGIRESDVITAGFTITPAGGTPYEIPVVLDRNTNTLFANVTDLTPSLQYACVAWVKLNSDPVVKSPVANFETMPIPPAVTYVAPAVVLGAKSDDGTTAKLLGSYTDVSIRPSDVITAGFTLTPAGGSPNEKAATVDQAGRTFTADLTSLIPGIVYTVVAWSQLNSETAVSSNPMTFTTAIAVPVEITVTFSNANNNTATTENDGISWGLPINEQSFVAEEKAFRASGYDWFVYGGCIKNNENCLWIGAKDRHVFIEGYLRTQEFTGITVTSITFPNNGAGPSGEARFSIYVSTDGGENFVYAKRADNEEWPFAPGTGAASEVELKLIDQQEGSMYKIQNHDLPDLNNGPTKSTYMIIKGIK